jgi:hypothetical protein
MRLVAAGLEGQLDEVFGCPIGGEPDASAGCEDRERISLRTQHVRDLSEDRDGDELEKTFVVTARLIGPGSSLRRTPARTVDRFEDASFDL